MVSKRADLRVCPHTWFSSELNRQMASLRLKRLMQVSPYNGYNASRMIKRQVWLWHQG